jgi:hypothetical protein
MVYAEQLDLFGFEEAWDGCWWCVDCFPVW